MRVKFDDGSRLEGCPDFCASAVVGLEVVATQCGDRPDPWTVEGAPRELRDFRGGLTELRDALFQLAHP